MTPINDRNAENHVDLDQALRALSHTARRRLLATLAENDHLGQRDLETGAFEPDDGTEAWSAVELHHLHLPLLDEADFIDWDRRGGRVHRGAAFAEIRFLLELLDDHREELPDGWP